MLVVLAMTVSTFAATWLEAPSVTRAEYQYEARASAHLAAPYDAVARVVDAVERYAEWVPTVSEVREVARQGDVVRAGFSHAIPILPDFPCVVELEFTRDLDLIRVAMRFLECIFDEQQMELTLTRTDSGSDVNVTWMAEMRRWYVPGAALHSFVKSATEKLPDALEQQALLL